MQSTIAKILLKLYCHVLGFTHNAKDSKAAKDTKDAKDTSKDSSKDSYKETPKEELERAREEISNIKDQLSKV